MSLRRKRLLGAVAVLLLVGAAAGYRLLRPAGVRPGIAAPLAVRTVRVYSGRLERTLRLTGTTAPERFSALLAPRLQGSHHGPRAHSVAAATITAASITGSTSGRSSTGSSTTSSSSSTSSSGQSDASGTSTSSSGTTAQVSGTGSGTLSGGNLGTALNRFSTPTSSSSSTKPASAAAATPVTSSEDLGSTASRLLSAPGAGGSDWNLTLQKVVPPGAHVRKGEIIAEFDRQYQLLRVDDYRTDLDQLNEGLKTLQASLDVSRKAHQQSIDTAQATLEKARYDLKTIPVQSAIVSEQLRLAEEEAALQYKQLEAQVKYMNVSDRAEYEINVLERDQSKIEYERAQANADKMLLKAPIDGVTVMGSTWRGGEMGQIQAGDDLHPGVLVMRVVDPSSMVIEANANQADIELLRLGLRARVHFDAYPDLVLTARLHAIGAMPKAGGFRASFVKEVPVVLKLDRLDERVIPDLSVGVDIILDSAEESVVAPREGIFYQNGQPYVWVARAGSFERRPIELGLMNNIAAVVRSGLAAGERIAVERPPEARR